MTDAATGKTPTTEGEYIATLFIIQALWTFPALGLLYSFFASPEGTVHIGISFPVLFLPWIIAVLDGIWNETKERLSGGGGSNA